MHHHPSHRRKPAHRDSFRERVGSGSLLAWLLAVTVLATLGLAALVNKGRQMEAERSIQGLRQRIQDLQAEVNEAESRVAAKLNRLYLEKALEEAGSFLVEVPRSEVVELERPLPEGMGVALNTESRP